MKIDELDLKLILALEEDARQGSEALAKKFDCSSGTIRRRLSKLIKSGVLRIVALVNPAKVGFPIIVSILMNVSHNNLKAEAKSLRKNPNITWVAITTGRFDLLTLAVFRSTKELSYFMDNTIAGIQGLTSIETWVWLDIKKGGWFSI